MKQAYVIPRKLKIGDAVIVKVPPGNHYCAWLTFAQQDTWLAGKISFITERGVIVKLDKKLEIVDTIIQLNEEVIAPIVVIRKIPKRVR